MKKCTVLVALAAIVAVGLPSAEASIQLINNGDFELGNQGFSSDYTYVTPVSPTSTVLVEHEQTYAIVDDVTKVHTNPVVKDFGDHTTGTGLMMAVNGATSGSPVVWGQTVGVTPGQIYLFSLWHNNWDGNPPADVEILINDVKLGQFTGPDAPSDGSNPAWQYYGDHWVAGAGVTQATVEIIATSTEFSGNDFALDDISMIAVPEPATLAIWSLLGLGFITGLRMVRGGRKMAGGGRPRWSAENRRAIEQIVSRGRGLEGP